MKRLLISIINILLIFILQSCNSKALLEADIAVSNHGPITFIAEPKGYIHSLVTRAEGDITPDKFDAEDESRIFNAYFLLFDGQNSSTDAQRILRVCSLAEVNSTNQVEYSLDRDLLNCDISDALVCFLANVSPSDLNNFEVGTTSWADFKSANLNITYAPASVTGTLGVPYMDIDGDGTRETPCMPMFASRKIGANNSILLERLFARVELYLSLGIEDNDNLSTLLSQPQFGLSQCTFHNLPKLAPIVPQASVTICSEVPENQTSAKLNNEELLTYNLSSDGNKMLYYSSDDAPSYKSFYIYVPEHKLGNLGSNNDPKLKPDLIKGTNKRPTYASINGYLVNGDGDTYEVTYNIYFGENSTNNFDISRNTLYRNYVRITGTANGPDVDFRVEKLDKQEEMTDDLTKFGQSANCYIISTEGSYMLPAYKGAYTKLANAVMCDVGTNEVIACDNPNISITIDETKSKQSTIVFNVKNTGGTGSLLSGNAIIARYNLSGDIEWSWHLWFIPGISWGNGSDDLSSTNRIGGLQHETLYDGTVMANRNLGVTGSVTNVEGWLQGTQSGFYYKYGHPNPYFEDNVYQNGRAYHGYIESEYRSWDNTEGKSVTDPCPPGYRVPSATVWEGSNNTNATKEHYSVGSGAFRYWNNGEILGVDINIIDDIYYPYSGFVGTDETVKDGKGLDQTPTEITVDYKITVKTDYKPVGDISYGLAPSEKLALIRYQEQSFTEYEYSQFKYQLNLETTHCGHLWGSKDKYLYYAYKKSGNCNGLQIISCNLRTRSTTRTMKQTRKSLRKDWPTEWEESILPASGNWSSYQNISADRNDVLIDKDNKGSINNSSWQAELKSDQSNKTFTFADTVPYTSTPSEGYQVRCVKE